MTVNQLTLNLDLVESSDIEYREFTIVISQTKTIRRSYRSKSNKNNNLFGVDTFEFPIFESRIYKTGSPHSGKLIARDEMYTKEDIILVTKAWIDSHVYGEKEKYKFRR